MAIGYTWDCKTCDTYPTKSGKSNVVYNVHWRLTATDDTNKDSDGNNWTASCYGAQELDTNSDVQAWVEAALGSDEVTNMKASLDANIAKKITPTSVQKTLSS